MAAEIPISAPPSRFIRKWLMDQSIIGNENAASASWPSTIAQVPTSPDNFVTLTDTFGILDGRNLSNGQAYNHPGIQVRVRSQSFDSAYMKGLEIQTSLSQNIGGQLISLDVSRIAKIEGMKLTMPLSYMGEETQNRRHVVVFNMVVTIRSV